MEQRVSYSVVTLLPPPMAGTGIPLHMALPRDQRPAGWYGAATSEPFLGAGVAGVQYVVTPPAGSRQGIGTAMTLRVVQEVRAIDYRVGVVTAPPKGIGSYRHIGFREYGWFRCYESGSADSPDS